MDETSSKYNLKKEVDCLKKFSPYFNYDDIKKLLKEKKIQITNSSLKVYLHSLTKNKIIFDAGKGWYSSIEKQFDLDKEPIEDIIKDINQKLPLLSFSCWSTAQLNSFTHHIMSKFITFIHTDSDYISNTAEMLRGTGYNVYENPNKAEIEKQFSLIDKTVIIRPLISKQPDNNKNDAPIEKILVDFLIENKKLNIMEESEAGNVVKNVLISGRINLSALISYSKRRKCELPGKLTKSN